MQRQRQRDSRVWVDVRLNAAMPKKPSRNLAANRSSVRSVVQGDTMSTAATTYTTATADQRAACAALAIALEAEVRKLPRTAKWWQRQPFTDALANARQMAEYGNGGGVLHYTENPTVLALAEKHGVPVAPAPSKATDAGAARLACGLHMTAMRRPYLRA